MFKKLRNFFLVKENLYLLGLVLVGAVLRLYKFSGFVTFLGDQGRDVIIIKRILTLEHFPAIGPPTSIGQIYLGPFFYYFIAPWLLLFRFDPVGPALGVAFFSILYLFINFFIVKELLDKKVAFISTILLTFSITLIDFSRTSWNPNLLPLFSLLTVYFLIKSFKTSLWYYYLLFGAFLAFCIQLHYIALLLLPAAAIAFLIDFLERKKKWKQVLKGIIISASSFIFFSLPLLIFDLRHDFLNSKSFLRLWQSTTGASTNKLSEILNTFLALNKYSFYSDISAISSAVILLLFIISFVAMFRKKQPVRIFLLFFIILVLGLGLFGGPKYPHYFGALYPLYYILIAYFLALLFQATWGKAILSIFLISYVGLQASGYYFFTHKENNQIAVSKRVAQAISDNLAKDKYTVTALPQRYSDSTYRYFLEIWGKKPIEKDSLDRADELFVVCEVPCSPIIGNPQWDIAYFAPRKIILTKKVDNITIYKLIR